MCPKLFQWKQLISMTKRQYNYLDHLILTAKKYEVEEYLYNEQKGRKLTAKQIELIL